MTHIEDYTMYCVDVRAKNVSESFLFPNVFSRCFGFQIKFAKAQGIEVLVRNFRRPCKIEEVNFNEPLEELFANEKLETKDKKDIVNKTIGLCEKKYNSSHVCKIFQNYIEAQHYQLKYSGRIYALQQSIMKSMIKFLMMNQKMTMKICVLQIFLPNIRISIRTLNAQKEIEFMFW